MTEARSGEPDAAPRRQPGVVVRGLSVSYGDLVAVCGVDLHIEKGEVLGLLGPNGAGKSTIIDAITGLRAPSAGAIEICGVDLLRRPADAKRKIGLSMQTTGLPAAITPREALEAFARLYGVEARVGELEARFGLEAKSGARVATLSGGQKQRLALALAFINDPELLVLDEPTAGLDPASRRELHGYIGGLKREGRAVLIATHDMDEAYRLCDRLIVLHQGRIVAQGAPGALASRVGAAMRVEVHAAAPVQAEWLSGEPLFDHPLVDGSTVSFSTANLEAALARLMAVLSQQAVEVVSLRASRASLEDIIAELVQRPGLE